MGPGREVTIGLLMLGASATHSSPAFACKSPGNTEHEITAGPAGEPPGMVEDISFTVDRGQGPEGTCSRSSTSCDDIGNIQLHFRPPVRDDLPAASIGYRIDLVDGDPPGTGLLPGNPVRAMVAGGSDAEATLFLSWIDDAKDEQEAFHFTITLTAIGPAGEEGPTSEPVRIGSAGSSGCAVRHGVSRDLSWAMAMLAASALFAMRRRIGRARWKRGVDGCFHAHGR